ncbi:MAG TPA: DUF6186 family protein [Acidimicrobiales bacterium]|nr:DUF6186 family protein [Acidimicrobiales bacterium]
MTAGFTVVAYAAIVVAAVALELTARTREAPGLGEVLAAALRIRPVRVALLAGWLWVGWHVFVRVDWQ